ncbi:MAG: EAL domain-containing protein [Treponema sp.]|nr:EAL domain-containing protein [Treponema sp.]
MTFPTLLRFFFILVSLILCGIIIFLAWLMFRKKNAYRNYIIIPIVFGIYSILSYSLFLLVDSTHHTLALITDAMYFIGTDWMALYVFIFAIVYTEILIKHKQKFIVIFSLLCLIDTISLIANVYTGHMFDLVLKYDSFGDFFWANDFRFYHYLHLALCYIMVGTTFVLFIIISIRVSSVYKPKYVGILIAYIVVIIANGISYSLNIPIDFSVILYAILAGFICYYSTYTFPYNVLYKTLEAVNETINDAVLYYDYAGNCIYANKAAKSIFATEDGFSAGLAEKYLSEWEKRLSFNPNLNKDSFEVKSVLHYYRVDYQIRKNSKEIEGFFLRLVDETLEILNFQKERYLTTHDELTGIYNRTGFFEAVDNMIKEKNPKNHIMICSDIKDFKLINELFGEAIGDEVLKKIGEILAMASHEGTIYGRIGDDKFAVYTDKQYFTEESFKKYIDSVITITESSLFRMHIYVGVYDSGSLLEKAQIMVDKCFLAISEIFGDYDKVFSYYNQDLMERLLDERNIASDFEDAISQNQIKMFLQPVFDIENNILGAEALCRWEHPVRGTLLPSDFLGILEKLGMVYLLDEYIWEQAVKTLKKWNESGNTKNYISVNVSIKDFYFTDIYKTFTHLAKKYDIDPSKLHIEINESVLMSDFYKAHELSTKLQSFGFIVAIDNFGSGYSSLNMLKDFKPHLFKLDISLLQDTDDLNKNEIILDAIIKMAETLEIGVIGIGVETDRQIEILKKLGCKNFQGHGLGKPMKLEEFENSFLQKE